VFSHSLGGKRAFAPDFLRELGDYSANAGIAVREVICTVSERISPSCGALGRAAGALPPPRLSLPQSE